HGLLVSVESNETAFRGNIDLVGMMVAEGIVTGIKAVLEDIGHGDEFGLAFLDAKSVRDGAGAASAAADKSQLKRFVAGGVHIRHGHARQSADGGDAARGLDELTTRRKIRLIHNDFVCAADRDYRRASGGVHAEKMRKKRNGAPGGIRTHDQLI